MTEKLYYQNGHLARFTARVLSCARDEKGWAVKLDRTAFFPGGGGQEADEGELSGLNLLGRREEGEDVVHLVPEPLEPGALVEGKLNWPALALLGCRDIRGNTYSPARYTASLAATT